MSGADAAPAVVPPQQVTVRIDVGGTVFRTSLHTLMEGARLGSPVFQALCLQILGPAADGCSPWEQRAVPAHVQQQHGVKHFVDADPTPWPYWLEYLREVPGAPREVPYVKAGELRATVSRSSERAGLAELAEGLRQLVDWRRDELQALLVRPGGVFHGARLRGQDLSTLGFARCSLGSADLSACTLVGCSFEGADLRNADLRNAGLCRAKLAGADLRGAKLAGADLSGADLSNVDLRNNDLRNVDLSQANLTGTNLSGCSLVGATLPPWSSGRMAGVKQARGRRGGCRRTRTCAGPSSRAPT